MIEIKNRWTGEVIRTVEADTLSDANLRGAYLSDANLRGAYLPTAPTVEGLHSKILAAIAAGGHLEMNDWHTCETTHCRAGWAIHLAGNEGYELEKKLGAPMAGALIHLQSCPWMERVPDFYASNSEALEDIQRCAKKETAA